MNTKTLQVRTFRTVISDGNKLKGEVRYYPLFCIINPIN